MTENPVGPPPRPLLHPPWGVRVANPDGADLNLIWRWMNEPHVERGWHQAWDERRWAADLEHQLSQDHSLPCVVYYNDQPIAYQEYYRVARDQLGQLYRVDPHDLGVHTCIGDVGNIGRKFGSRLLRAAAEGLLAADPECTRVIGEPNVTNQAAVKACLNAGFRYYGDVRLPHKTAALMIWSYQEPEAPL